MSCVLWVDEDQGEIPAVGQMLSDIGLPILPALSIADAERALNTTPEIAAILLDMIVQKGEGGTESGRYSGLELYRRLSSELQAKTIVVSIVPRGTLTSAGLPPAVPYFSKMEIPSRIGELRTTITQIACRQLESQVESDPISHIVKSLLQSPYDDDPHYDRLLTDLRHVTVSHADAVNSRASSVAAVAMGKWVSHLFRRLSTEQRAHFVDTIGPQLQEFSARDTARPLIEDREAMNESSASGDQLRLANVFVSYAHADESIKNELLRHIRPLERLGNIRFWTDRSMNAGDEWRDVINRELENASIALLLVSADFLNSTFCQDEELPALLRARARRGARIIPIILHPCAWMLNRTLAGFLALPKDGKPISTYRGSKREEILAGLGVEIMRGLVSDGLRE